MNEITPDLLARQRNFFLCAIALELLSDLLAPITGFDLFESDACGFNTIASLITAIAVIAYGFYMGRKGYLKKYVAYTFAVCGVATVFCLIGFYIPVDGEVLECVLVLAVLTAMITSITGSAMSKPMKWGLIVGLFVVAGAIDYAPNILFTSEEIAADPVLKSTLPQAIVAFVGDLIAALLILAYYNRRIASLQRA